MSTDASSSLAGAAKLKTLVRCRGAELLVDGIELVEEDPDDSDIESETGVIAADLVELTSDPD